MRLIAFTLLGLTSIAAAQAPTAHFTEREICRAGIAALFGRNVKTVKVGAESGKTVHLEYVRPDDRTRWTYVCRVDGWRVMWGSPGGRWRDDPLDETVEFTSTPSMLTLNVSFAGDKPTVHKFTKVQLR